MRIVNYIHPQFPNNRRSFTMALDLVNVSTILNNGGCWDITMENGEKVRMDSEGEGPFQRFVEQCEEAKLNRDASNSIRRQSY